MFGSAVADGGGGRNDGAQDGYSFAGTGLGDAGLGVGLERRGERWLALAGVVRCAAVDGFQGVC